MSKESDVEVELMEGIQTLRNMVDAIVKNRDQDISQEQLKIFMVLTTGSLMALHLLLRKDVEVKKN